MVSERWKRLARVDHNTRIRKKDKNNNKRIRTSGRPPQLYELNLSGEGGIYRPLMNTLHLAQEYELKSGTLHMHVDITGLYRITTD